MADSDLSEILRNTSIGQLNAFSLERFGLKTDQYNYNKLTYFREAVSDLYEKALDRSPGGPYNAYCLAASQDPIGNIPGIPNPTAERKIPTSGYLIKVVARIEELHACIPKPILSGVGQLSCIESKNLSILLHPVFYSFRSQQSPLPEPGNIVLVDFIDKADRSYGEYLGLVDNNIKACKSISASPSRVMETGAEQLISDSS